MTPAPHGPALVLCVVIAAMLALVLLNNEIWNPGLTCPLCGGRREHGRNCPYKEDE